jgi:hypothetical protein
MARRTCAVGPGYDEPQIEAAPSYNVPAVKQTDSQNMQERIDLLRIAVTAIKFDQKSVDLPEPCA